MSQLYIPPLVKLNIIIVHPISVWTHWTIPNPRHKKGTLSDAYSIICFVRSIPRTPHKMRHISVFHSNKVIGRFYADKFPRYFFVSGHVLFVFVKPVFPHTLRRWHLNENVCAWLNASGYFKSFPIGGFLVQFFDEIVLQVAVIYFPF